MTEEADVATISPAAADAILAAREANFTANQTASPDTPLSPTAGAAPEASSGAAPSPAPPVLHGRDGRPATAAEADAARAQAATMFVAPLNVFLALRGKPAISAKQESAVIEAGAPVVLKWGSKTSPEMLLLLAVVGVAGKELGAALCEALGGAVGFVMGWLGSRAAAREARAEKKGE